MVDSNDKSKGTWGNFTINRANSLLNGFFHRVGATEIVLEWLEPNIVNGVNDATVATVVGTAAPINISLQTGFYTVAQALNEIVFQMNTAIGANNMEVVQFEGGSVALNNTANNAFSFSSTPLSNSLSIFSATPADTLYVIAPDLRPYRYIDFVSSQLTYNQKLKDASTAPMVHDVLARWYFAWDTPPSLDALGFPILMGYTPFVVRRTFSPAKQIRWESNMPVGQINFQVYDDDGALISTNDNNAFLMTLQVSED